MSVLTVRHPGGTTKLYIEQGETILSALRRGGLAQIEAPCGGNGRCGKCLVEVTGAVTPADGREAELLLPGEHRRLACLACAEGDCTVVLKEDRAKIAGSGIMADYPLTSGARGLGAAVDIGTTTVVVYLYCRETGKKLGQKGEMNAQRSYGGDVISRIQYTTEQEDGLGILKNTVCAQLRILLTDVCREAGRQMDEIEVLSVAGNTVMEHLFAGLSPASIAVAPFTPVSLFGAEVSGIGETLGLSKNCRVWLAPCISGYVGGDITCGLLSSGAGSMEDTVLFLDVGTNGEMALGDKNGFVCCATAAGPAFEGGAISCGMAANPGAIHQVWLEDGEIRYSVLGEVPAVGLCGSGLLDLLAVLLECGVVDETGRLLPEEEAPEKYRNAISGQGKDARFRVAEGVYLTVQDVRALQLAKAAISAGIQVLLDAAGRKAEDVSVFCLAGGFGSFLRPESAAAIGLFPEALLPRIRVLGNSAGMGASLAMLSEAAGEELDRIVKICSYLELSGRADFTDAYMDGMMFD